MMFHYWPIRFTAAHEFAFGKQEVFLPLYGKNEVILGRAHLLKPPHVHPQHF